MSKKVSVIIPSFNNQYWLPEAIDSCLNQTYSNLEVIVVDDGSTDNSVEVLKGYRDKIIWETGPNRGGNYVRNRGFNLSTGDYIQYLDSDDYLLPEKIECQVESLEKNQGDVAYSDWRYGVHLPDGMSYLDEIKVCGPKVDFLESMLSNESWVAISAVLFTRSIVEKSGGWDESLAAAQDRDFLMTIALQDSKFIYQPGCHSVYRRYGNVTVSTRCKLRWLENHCKVMTKAEYQLIRSGRFSYQYRKALATGYFDMGREYLYSNYPHSINHEKFLVFLTVLEKAIALYPDFKAKDRKTFYNLVQQILGCREAETFSYFMTRTKLMMDSWLNSLLPQDILQWNLK